MTESHKIPAIAKTAITLLDASYQRGLSEIGDQTVAALGLDPDLDWVVDFTKGTIWREIAAAALPVPPVPPATP